MEPDDENEADEDFDQYEEEECGHCHGDGMDPMTDFLLPCPYCG